MWRESFEHGVGIIDPHPFADQERYFEGTVVPNNAVRVALVEGRIVGFIAASRTSISQLYVRKGFLRRRVGSLLLDWAKAQSDGSLWLYTFERNVGARAFYERNGFGIAARGHEPHWKLDDLRYEWLRGSAPMRLIATERLALQPQLAVHADEMFRVLSDPAIYEFENEPPQSLERLRARFARLETRRSTDGGDLWLNWVVRRGPVAIGYVQATVHRGGGAGIAYEFASAHWGQGFAQEAVRAMMAELAGRYGVEGVTAVLKGANHRSKRMLDRLGFSMHERGDIEADEICMRRDVP
jgi:RimJ/RimL family protein N-acetyltransferase